MKKWAVLAMVLGLLFSVAAGARPALAAQTGTVTVVHGVPGLTVDVYVNGALALPNFAPFTVTDPLQLPEGKYDIVIVPAGGDPANPAIAGSAFLPTGANVSIVAHLTAAGAPTLSVYANNLSGLKPGNSRLIVRHDAQAPAVDVKLARPGIGVGRSAEILKNLSNPNEATRDGAPGRFMASLAPAGTNQTVFGPVPVALRPGKVTIVYAVGSIGGGTFTLLSQNIPAR